MPFSRESLMAATLFIPLTLTCLSSCSSSTNTISGLTTPQSTITGSNYVFFTDPLSHDLSSSQHPPRVEEIIRPNDMFKISLDFGFLRYLQAVDPYVIVYSEAWMGDSPRPTDPALTHRQVVLIKDGLSQNAKLPISSQALLGPVTLDEGGQDVHVTLKVVVLSKHDNKESIQLLDGIAGAVATAAPTYAPIAGAAAQLGAAIVAQNKDKIEFEHTFTFTPRREQPYIDANRETILGLREGQIAVIKGESEFRIVPYQHWGYYAWPFNWFGNNVDRVSKGFETKTSEMEANYFNVIWAAVRLPIWVMKSLFLPAQWFADQTYGTYPTSLKVDGYSLFCKEQDDNPRIGSAHFFFFHRSYPCPYAGPYSEKSHMLFRVQKTGNTLGNFKELVTKFSEHGKTINELSTTSSEARKFSAEQVTKTFDAIKSAVIFERTKREAIDQAHKENYDPLESYCRVKELSNSERQALVQMTVDRRVDSTMERFTDFLNVRLKPAEEKARLLNEQPKLTAKQSTIEKLNPDFQGTAGKVIADAVRQNISALDLIPGTPNEIIRNAFNETISYMQSTSWAMPTSANDGSWLAAMWSKGWNRTLDITKQSILSSRNLKVVENFPKEDFKKLYVEVPRHDAQQPICPLETEKANEIDKKK